MCLPSDSSSKGAESYNYFQKPDQSNTVHNQPLKNSPCPYGTPVEPKGPKKGIEKLFEKISEKYSDIINPNKPSHRVRMCAKHLPARDNFEKNNMR